MSVKRQQIPITSPCPITLDRSEVTTKDRELFCAHCSKDVHLLSHMTEREARELMSRRAGEDICVSYAIQPDGQIRFRPEPPLVPPTSLVRSAPLRRGLSMAASIGAAALIAACTPHGETEIHVDAEAEQAKVEQAPIEQTPPVEVAGGLMAEPVPPEPCEPEDDLLVDGGIKAVPLDPPEPPEPPEPPDPNMGKVEHRRGGLRAKPVEPF